MILRILLILCAAWPAMSADDVVPAPPVAAAPAASRPYAPDEIAALLTRARSGRLGDHASWRTLLHYARTWLGRRSLIDSPAFFLAADGKDDAQAELEATLALLLAADGGGVPTVADRFPARCEWLITTLALDRSRLAGAGRSPPFEDAFAGFAPRSVAMVFPSAYMATPASMFGHTLLLVRSHFKNPRLAQAINYAAVTTESGGMVFAVRGLLGLYPGFYSLVPYSKKLRDYGDIDQRDVWEYELNLTPAEMRAMLLHAWEMRPFSADYFFFDENCAFNLLFMVDAARPGLDLVGKVQGLSVIPIDTLRAVIAAGLVDRVAYRPSLAAQVRARAKTMEPAEAELMHALGQGLAGPEATASLAPERRMEVLDGGIAYLQSLAGRKKVPLDTYRPRLLGLLQARAAIPVASPEQAVEMPGPPDSGHRSGRLALGGGSDRSEAFVEACWRPAYHDRMDPQTGFSPGSEIAFAETVVRWNRDESLPELHRLDGIRVRSFQPFDRFYQPPTWEGVIGLRRERMGGDGRWRHQAIGRISAGPGFSVVPGLQACVLAELDGRLLGVDERHAAGAGAVGELIADPLPRLRLRASARTCWYALGTTAHNWEATFAARVALARDWALSGEASRRQTWGADATAWGVSALWYF